VSVQKVQEVRKGLGQHGADEFPHGRKSTHVRPRMYAEAQIEWLTDESIDMPRRSRTLCGRGSRSTSAFREI
jgi:hypothetical protein